MSVVPECLEQKSSEGWTPLQTAVLVQREEVVSYLISCGANQRTRDKLNRNVIHSMVNPQRSNFTANSNVQKLQSLIELFDEEAVKEMMVERCTVSPGALTPLAYWMSTNRGENKNGNFLVTLCRHSNGDDLEMINGEGDLPLHVVRMHFSSTAARF